MRSIFLAVTTRGMKEEEMLDIADLLNEALTNGEDPAALERVHGKVREMMGLSAPELSVRR